MENLTIITAFVAGLLSFLAPCVLPIVPAYLSYITGANMGVAQQEESSFKINFKAVIPVLFFVIGFSTIFILLGASASFIGQFLTDYQEYIAKIGGALVVFFGLHFTNIFLNPNFSKYAFGTGLIIIALFTFGLISQETLFTLAGIWAVVMALYYLNAHLLLYKQLKTQKDSKATILSSFVVGLTFGAGWSPCIGPVLGSILMLAAQEDTVAKGMILLTAYSIGLGIPFIVAGLLWTGFMKFVSKFSKFFGIVEIVGGILLILIGTLLATGNLSLISSTIE